MNKSASWIPELNEQADMDRDIIFWYKTSIYHMSRTIGGQLD